MGNSKAGSDQQVHDTGVDPDVVAKVEDMAKAEGLPPEVAREIVADEVEAGVAPDKLQDVAEEAVKVERDDRGR